MKKVLVEIEDDIADQLEKVAPSRSRRRNEFIRMAIGKALWELEEAATAEAYARKPDSLEDEVVDPDAWEPVEGTFRGRKGKR